MQIYQILNKVTNKSYVGKSINYKTRFKVHIKNANKKINRRLYDSINYHGIDNFELILLEDLGDCTREYCNEREIYWINSLNSLMPNGYNMTLGRDGGNTYKNRTEEQNNITIERLSKSNTGKKRTKEQCETFSKVSKVREKNKTKEQKELISNKISSTLKRRYELGEIVAVTPAFYGKYHHEYIEVDIDKVLSMIKDCKTLKVISETLGVSNHAIRARLVEKTGKNFIQWRREYGIKGTLSRPRSD